MNRVWIGFVGPFLATAVVLVVLHLGRFSSQVTLGVQTGCLIALVQSQLSVLAMKWAWNTKWFYWSWGGGMLARMLVFGVTAFVVMQGRERNFLATMLSLVVATTLFLVFESLTIFWKKANGFSSSSRTSSS